MYNRYIDEETEPVAAAAPRLELVQGGGQREGGLSGMLHSLLGGFKLPSFELDDLLLLAIAYLLLRENGDDDLILILAALYFFGAAG